MQVPNLETLTENAFLSNLAKTASSVDARFCCTGSVPLKNDQLNLYFRVASSSSSSSSSSFNGITFPMAQPEQLSTLLAACSKATFGRGTEEVLDTNYRDAYKLDCPQFAVADFHPCEALIAEDVHRAMMPEARAIRLETYKLNVYGPGGRFKSHVDTPRSPDMFGSLVVCLPTAFSGGQLLIHHPLSSSSSSASSSTVSCTSSPEGCRKQDQVTVDWSSGPEVPKQIRWAAFYSDCEHEILPVTDGYRVTITYNLYAIEKDEEDEVVEEEAEEKNKRSRRVRYPRGRLASMDDLKDQGNFSFLTEMVPLPLQSVFLEALSCPAFMADGGTLGFACQHLYPHTWRKYNKRMAAYLKGADAVLFATASSLGLSVKVVPVYDSDEARHQKEEEEQEEEELETENKKKKTNEEADQDEEKGKMRKKNEEEDFTPKKGVYTLLPHFYEPYIDSHEERQVLIQPIRNSDITWVNTVRRNAWKEFAAQRVVYGNEPGTLENDYQAVAMLVTIPAWGTAKRNRCIHMKEGEVAGKRVKRKRETAEEEEKEEDEEASEDEKKKKKNKNNKNNKKTTKKNKTMERKKEERQNKKRMKAKKKQKSSSEEPLAKAEEVERPVGAEEQTKKKKKKTKSKKETVNPPEEPKSSSKKRKREEEPEGNGNGKAAKSKEEEGTKKKKKKKQKVAAPPADTPSVSEEKKKRKKKKKKREEPAAKSSEKPKEKKKKKKKAKSEEPTKSKQETNKTTAETTTNSNDAPPSSGRWNDWSQSSFADDAQKSKFLRLMGAAKPTTTSSSSPSPSTSSSHTNTKKGLYGSLASSFVQAGASSASSTNGGASGETGRSDVNAGARINTELESQFRSALDRRGRGALGLGFEEPRTGLRIDDSTSRSIKFAD
ncbi:Fe2OG dioxygenase domain-containing protein [Balamuthia mandrillaris]